MTRNFVPVVLIALAACGGGGAANNSDGSTETAQSIPSADQPTTETPEAPESAIAEPAAVEPVPTEPAVAPAQTIVSADGMLTLHVPAGAVPEGTDITIEPTSAPDGARGAFDFGPDGLEFSEPARLEWSLVLPADNSSTFSLGVMLDDGVIEQLDGASAELSEDGMILYADVEHFTDFVVSEVPGLRQYSPDGPVLVGQEFEFSVFRERGEDDTEMAIVIGANVPDPVRPHPFNPAYKCEVVGELEFRVLVTGNLNFIDDDSRAYERDTDLPAQAGRFAPFTLRARCIESFELTLVETDLPNAEPYPGPLSIRPGEDGATDFGFPTDQVMDGGTVSMVFEDALQQFFGECRIDRRQGGNTGCFGFNQFGETLGQSPIVELVEGDTTWMSIPEGVLDLVGGEFTLGDTPFAIGGTFVQVYDANGNLFDAATDLSGIG